MKAPRLGISSEVASEGVVCVVNGLIGIGDAVVAVSELILIQESSEKTREKFKKNERWKKTSARNQGSRL